MQAGRHDTVSYSDLDIIVIVLNVAVVSRLVKLDLVKGASFFEKKPPLHFHLQEGYIKAIRGKLAVETEGKEIILTPWDGRFPIKPYVNHRSYPISASRQDDGSTKVAFLLSGEKTDNVFELNPDEVVINGAEIDLIQLFCTNLFQTFDAGGTYVSFPSWVPLGQYVSLALGVVLFHRKWTIDWDLACSRMQQTIFQRRFADSTKPD
ncbi:uncharacterized protein LY79DRAFT_595523 [Colletotrichum navitas]|uniref:Uncharacterized protein n=1 Tax=Colletotrichum navitas TaxID=681940 RepID=A0AAD8PHZ8_9PEZI|nr:uncharacterized protein LY79DRAFT_595523 [Colletotrichum navitas]KAK1561434.1 hypothetical protein LY79DRAFT_595523 [Colletotrichum navitas]